MTPRKNDVTNHTRHEDLLVQCARIDFDP